LGKYGSPVTQQRVGTSHADVVAGALWPLNKSNMLLLRAANVLLAFPYELMNPLMQKQTKVMPSIKMVSTTDLFYVTQERAESFCVTFAPCSEWSDTDVKG